MSQLNDNERHDNSPHVLTYDLEGYPRQEERFDDKGAAEARANYVRDSGLGSNVSVNLEGAPDAEQPATSEPVRVIVEFVPVEPARDEPSDSNEPDDGAA
jgi:hypothetical protein